jgi:hypothetical protein
LNHSQIIKGNNQRDTSTFDHVSNGGKALQAVPVLQQKPTDQEEAQLRKLTSTVVEAKGFTNQQAIIRPPNTNNSITAFTVQRREVENTQSPIRTKYNPIQATTNGTSVGAGLKSDTNTVQRVQHLWMMPPTGDHVLDSEAEESRQRQEERSHAHYEAQRQKEKEARASFYELLTWDQHTIKTITPESEWNHANSSGTDGGAGMTGRKGKAIWLTSRNDRNAARGYSAGSGVLLVYKATKNLNVAVLQDGDQIFGDDIIHWQRDFPHIDGAFTDYGETSELCVFDSANLEFQNNEKI